MRATLIRNGVVARRQLFELVFLAPILDQIRSLYVELLLRPKDKTLDPMAVAVWGAALYTYGLRKELIDQIVWQLRQSPEYKEKHQ